MIGGRNLHLPHRNFLEIPKITKTRAEEAMIFITLAKTRSLKGIDNKYIQRIFPGTSVAVG